MLTEDALDDLIPSFLLSGQQTPAFGRRVSGVIEVADGSRRRKAAILTSSDYRILVGDLDDEQMMALSAWVMTIDPLVLMNVVSDTHTGWRMSLAEMFQHLLKQKAFPQDHHTLHKHCTIAETRRRPLYTSR